MADGNILFLVCSPCEQANAPDFGVKLAERSTTMWYQPRTPNREFAKWLMNHRKCGGHGEVDHFKLGYLKPLNHDQQQAKPIEKAVKLSVVN